MAAVKSPMYRTPGFYNDSGHVELPKCMYTVNSYHKHDDGENNHLQNNHRACNGIAEEDFSALEKRQESILSGLSNLQKEVKCLASKLGVRLPSKSCPMTVDHVISASPENPPLSLFILQHVLNQRGMTHSTSVFAHSSVAGQDLSKLPSFEQARNDNDRNSPCVITVIWKNAGNLPSLVISANHTPLVGEFTIARHLCRTLLPDLYAKLGLEQTAEVDNWLSFASDAIVNGKSKEKVNALHTLNAHLGKSSWLVGDRMTLADIAVASAILKTDSSKAPAHVKTWIKRIAPQY